MKATIELRGSDVFCHSEDMRTPEQRLDQESTLPLLHDLARRYDEAVRANSGVDTLRLIGSALWDWLDKPSGWAAAWSAGTGARVLDICVRPEALEDDAARALLDAPWELLAGPQGWLAEDAVQPFEVVRRIGAAAAPRVAEFADLQMLFMAAAPEGQHVLSFEAEEAAILEATQRKPLHLFVEETGSAEWLKDRLDVDAPFDVLHLSCHGDIDKRDGPVLLFEDDCGKVKRVTASILSDVIGDASKLPLLFLSACRTAERLEAGEEGRRRAAEPMVRDLIRAGVAHVLGWDGSVRDVDAMAFAELFYAELTRGQTVAQAAARARSKLVQTARTDPDRGAHWHLARLYVGARGGGPLIARQGPQRQYAGKGVEKEFLDKENRKVPVAGAAFVGRRRVLQRVFRAFAEIGDAGRSCGVLLHGMGNLGKSSVAERVARRLRRHKTVVVFERYDALTVFDRVTKVVPEECRAAFKRTWRDAVMQDPSTLADALEALLDLLGSYHDGKQAAAPLLLIIDDLERILETPQPGDEAGVRVKTGDGRVALQAILTAFDRMAGRTASRLLLTSRYRFTLPDIGCDDLAAKLIAVPMQPMNEIDREKQYFAKSRKSGAFYGKNIITDEIHDRALMVGGGNPGFQNILTELISCGTVEEAEFSINGVAKILDFGSLSQCMNSDSSESINSLHPSIGKFFSDINIDCYIKILTEKQILLLKIARLFDINIPVPYCVFEEIYLKFDENYQRTIRSLINIGLIDDYGELYGEKSGSANYLSYLICEPFSGSDLVRAAVVAKNKLCDLWLGSKNDLHKDYRSLCLWRTLLQSDCDDVEEVNIYASMAARYLFFVKNNVKIAKRDVIDPAERIILSRGGNNCSELNEMIALIAARDSNINLLRTAVGKIKDSGCALKIIPDGPVAHKIAKSMAMCGDYFGARNYYDCAVVYELLSGGGDKIDLMRGDRLVIFEARGV